LYLYKPLDFVSSRWFYRWIFVGFVGSLISLVRSVLPLVRLVRWISWISLVRCSSNVLRWISLVLSSLVLPLVLHWLQFGWFRSTVIKLDFV
jgi:hypothetical protein